MLLSVENIVQLQKKKRKKKRLMMLLYYWLYYGLSYLHGVSSCSIIMLAVYSSPDLHWNWYETTVSDILL